MLILSEQVTFSNPKMKWTNICFKIVENYLRDNVALYAAYVLLKVCDPFFFHILFSALIKNSLIQILVKLLQWF